MIFVNHRYELIEGGARVGCPLGVFRQSREELVHRLIDLAVSSGAIKWIETVSHQAQSLLRTFPSHPPLDSVYTYPEQHEHRDPGKGIGDESFRRGHDWVFLPLLPI